MSDVRGLLPPWLLPLWQQVTRDLQRLPHALLLEGPAGSGKRQFAEQLARRLLCVSPASDGFACGACPACKWFAAANHPDMHRMVPASAALAEQEEGEDGEGGESSAKDGKKASDQIVIDQVRSMQSLLEVGGHQGGRRVVLIDPAEAMNVPTANALLKSLEEPPGDAVFLLVSHSPRRLLPTIRSRCQGWSFPRPDKSAAQQWLAAQRVDDAEALLGFSSGLPLAAATIAGGPLAEARKRFMRDMQGLGRGDPLKLAGEWEAWLKSKAALEAGLTLTVLVSWLQRWAYDASRAAQGVAPRFFVDAASELAALTKGRFDVWSSCYNELAGYRRVSQHPLNARLFLEDMLLRTTRAMTVK